MHKASHFFLQKIVENLKAFQAGSKKLFPRKPQLF